LLVIDDEPLVRDVLVRQAEASGWRAVGFGSAADALEQLLHGGVDVDAIVCDLRMPGMTGQQFHDQLARSAPHWLERIVFVTGDLASREASAFARRCRAPIVGKPFVPRELLARVLELPRVAVG
jgi:CheY-like chemotaxis protein